MRFSVTFRLLGILGIGCGLGGCIKQQQTFLPAGPNVVNVDAKPATRYELQGGNVLIASLPTRPDPRTSDGRLLIGVRMDIANEWGPKPWTIDVREQTATLGPNPELPGADPVADYVVTPSGSPVVTIEPGKHQSIEYYFGAPARLNNEPIRQIAFDWNIQTGDDLVARQTNLYRATLVPSAELQTDYGDALGHLWYDSNWTQGVYFFPPLVMRYRVVPQW